jgi:excisionase family DNA binding protein
MRVGPLRWTPRDAATTALAHMTEHAVVERLVYRVGELAEALATSRWTVNRLIKSGELATTRVGTTTVVPVDEVERYLVRHLTRTVPAGQRAVSP